MKLNLFRIRDTRAAPDAYQREPLQETWKPGREPDSPATHSLTETLVSIRNFITEYVSLTDDQSLAITLWIAHTHLIKHAACTPYMSVTSAEKRSGKTRLLEVCELLVHNPLRTSSITEAALYHALSEKTMTLLMDEVDTIFKSDNSRELLRAILNASYRRGSPVYRMKGKKVEAFDVFSAKMIAGIGVLPDTVADRSIPIRMERGSPISRFRYSECQRQSTALRAALAEACKSFTPVQDPVLPDLNDRAQDSWEPLLGIAEEVDWGEQAREAAERLHDSS